MVLIPDIIEQIQMTTLADQIIDQLRKAIITGQIRGGERLSEPQLAAQLGVSRSPVREALKRLQIDGLVIGQPNHGCYVWSPSDQDIREIFSLRTMIEILAAEWVIDVLEENDFALLNDSILQTQKYIEKQDYFKLIHEDKHFHEYICSRAGHNRLMDHWRQIMWQWELLISYRIRVNPEAVVHSVVTDHQELLAAFRSRNLDKVTWLHRTVNDRVIQSTRDALMDSPKAAIR